MKRIFLTPDEKQKIVYEAFRIAKSIGWSLSSKRGIGEIAQKSQLVLPPDRRRNLNPADWKFIKEGITELYKKEVEGLVDNKQMCCHCFSFGEHEKNCRLIIGEDLISVPVKPTEEHKPAHNKSSNLQLDNLFKELKTRIVESPLVDALINESIEDIKLKFLEKLINEFSSYDLQIENSEQHEQENFSIELPNKERLPVIGILGCKPNQIFEIQTIFKNKLTIRPYYADNSGASFKNSVRGVEKCFIMTKFISHNHQDIVKKVLKPENIVYVNGAVTDLARTISSKMNIKIGESSND